MCQVILDCILDIFDIVLGDCLKSTENLNTFGFRLQVQISLLWVVLSLVAFVFRAFAWPFQPVSDVCFSVSVTWWSSLLWFSC